MEREVIETRGDYRAVIIRDEYPDAPDWDMQAAVIRFDSARIESKTDATSGFMGAAQRFASRYGMSDGILTLERYARIFHGTRDFRVFGYSYSRDNVVYVAFDSAAMRAEWGCSADADNTAKGDAETWQAYIDGDVYGIAVEQRAATMTTRVYPDGTQTETLGEVWETVDGSDVWGYYGEEDARAEALADLAHYAPKGGDSK